jgi:hypothetical protein
MSQRLKSYLTALDASICNSKKYCYKCKRKGHIARQCSQICKKCGIAHTEKVCVGDLCQLVIELNYFNMSHLQEFRRDTKKKYYTSMVKNLDQYLDGLLKIADKHAKNSEVKSYRKRIKKELELDDIVYDDEYIQAEVDKFRTSLPPKVDSTPDFRQLVIDGLELSFLKEVKEATSKMREAIINKVSNVYSDTVKFTNQLKDIREKSVLEDHKKFLENKKLGIKNVIDFKTTQAQTAQQFAKVKQMAAREIDNVNKYEQVEQKNFEKEWFLIQYKQYLDRYNQYLRRYNSIISIYRSFGKGDDYDHYSEDAKDPDTDLKITVRNVNHAKELRDRVETLIRITKQKIYSL